MLDGVDVAFFLFFFLFQIAKPVAPLVADIPVFWPWPALVVDLLQKRHLVVEVLQVGLRIEADVAAVLDGAPQRVLGKRCPVPSERTLVARVGTDPIGQWQLVQRQFVCAIHLVVVGRHLPAFHQTRLHFVPVRIVTIGIIHLVWDFSSLLYDQGLRCALVVQLQGLCQVVFDRVVPVPCPSLHNLWGDDGFQPKARVQRLHVVAHLTDLVHPLHLVRCRNLFGQQIEIEISDPLQVLRVAQETHLGEGGPLFGLGLPAVIQPAAMFHIAEIVRVNVLPVLLIETVVGGEVRWVQKRKEALAAVASTSAATTT